MKNKIEFSYMQILIIVLAIGICGKVIMPRITNAGNESKTSEVLEKLYKVRAQLELYRAFHDGQIPSCKSSKGFEKSLFKVHENYIPRLTQLPENPINEKSSVRIDGEPAGTGQAGWRYDSTSGWFASDSDTYTSRL